MNNKLQNLKHLLEKLEIVQLRHEETKKKKAFNVFTILRKAHDEVNLHSQFIAYLLNPKSDHYQGTRFLKSFLEACGLTFDENTSYWVHKEKAFGEHGRIDILIESSQEFIAIENKIYAEDQPKQLQRYHVAGVETKKKVYLLYLTRHGEEPSQDGKGCLRSDQYKCISYKDTINTWIENWIEECTELPSIKEVLVQYQNLISQLTGNSINMAEALDVIEVLKENKEYLSSAYLIASSWEEIKIQAEIKFWKEVLRVFNQSSKTANEEEKMTCSTLEEIIRRPRSIKKFTGILTDLKVSDETSPITLHVYIERNFHGIYYFGLQGYKDGRRIEGDERDKDILDKIMSISENLESGHWFGYRHFNEASEVRFDPFSEEAIKMLDSISRKKAIEKMQGQIEDYIKEVENTLKHIG